MRVLVYLVAIAWSIYLGKWLLSRRQRRSMSSISTFSKHLAVLGKTTPGRRPTGTAPFGPLPVPRHGPMTPPGMSIDEARSRRRQVLTALAGVASLTAVLAFVAGGPFVVVHLLCDGLVVGYVGLLIRTQKLAADRRSKVVYLPTAARRRYEPELLRRTADQ